jgi:hypothetical protein
MATYTEEQYMIAMNAITLVLTAYSFTQDVAILYARSYQHLVVHELLESGEYEQLDDVAPVEEARGFVTAINVVFPLLSSDKFREFIRLMAIYQYEKEGLIEKGELTVPPTPVTIQ